MRMDPGIGRPPYLGLDALVKPDSLYPFQRLAEERDLCEGALALARLCEV